MTLAEAEDVSEAADDLLLCSTNHETKSDKQVSHAQRSADLMRSLLRTLLLGILLPLP